MHWNANRAALVGDGTGDGLTNPPRRISAEFKPATVFKFVDCPHETGVAFLDQVQETQATVSVFLGDGDDQPQVAFRKLSLSLLLFCVDLGEKLDGISQARRGFLSCLENIAILLQPLLTVRVILVAFVVDFLFEFIHTATELLQRADHRFQTLGSQAEFFDQLNGSFTAAAQVFPSGTTFGLAFGFVGRGKVVCPIAAQKFFDRAQVMRQTTENLFLLQSVGNRNLHRTIERQFAGVNAIQNLEGRLKHVVAFEQAASELLPGLFDFLGEANFFLASKK